MQNRWLRRIGFTVGTVIVVVLVVIAGVYAFTAYRFNKRYTVAPHTVTVTTDSETIARGHHFAMAIGKCVDCHGADLGGKAFIDDPMMGRIVASNLTTGTGGVLASYSDSLLERAIRRGIRRDGTPLLVMPSADFQYMSDQDVAAVIAYIRSLPPVNHALPAHHVTLFTRTLYTAGQFPLFAAEHLDTTLASLAQTPHETPEAMGHYIALVGGCVFCHGSGLSGGKIPGVPPDWKPAANLTRAGIGQWTEADFVRALRQGVRPDQSPIDTIMPWRLAGGMTDDEMHAVWAYLQSVPPKAFGNR